MPRQVILLWICKIEVTTEIIAYVVLLEVTLYHVLHKQWHLRGYTQGAAPQYSRGRLHNRLLQGLSTKK